MTALSASTDLNEKCHASVPPACRVFPDHEEEEEE
jgi:hypothetical protein